MPPGHDNAAPLPHDARPRPDLTAFRVVLVETSHAGNAGAVARVMANFGLRDLVFVAPRCDPRSQVARQRAARGEPLLDSARIVDTLEDALAGATFTAAASCRGGLYRRQIELAAEHFARDAVRHLASGAGPVALAFGPEDRGLTNAQCLLVDRIVRVPTVPAYPSLNVAVAAAICLYEVFRASLALTPPPPAPADLADAALIARLMDRLRDALGAIGYLDPHNPEHLLFALRGIFGRARLTRTEARILIGLAQQIRAIAPDRHPRD